MMSNTGPAAAKHTSPGATSFETSSVSRAAPSRFVNRSVAITASIQTGVTPTSAAANRAFPHPRPDYAQRRRTPAGARGQVEPWNDESHDPVTGTPVAQYDHFATRVATQPNSREQVAAYS